MKEFYFRMKHGNKEKEVCEISNDKIRLSFETLKVPKWQNSKILSWLYQFPLIVYEHRWMNRSFAPESAFHFLLFTLLFLEFLYYYVKILNPKIIILKKILTIDQFLREIWISNALVASHFEFWPNWVYCEIVYNYFNENIQLHEIFVYFEDFSAKIVLMRKFHCVSPQN